MNYSLTLFIFGPDFCSINFFRALGWLKESKINITYSQSTRPVFVRFIFDFLSDPRALKKLIEEYPKIECNYT